MSSEYDDLIMLAERRELESALAKAVRQRDEARHRARRACQMLIAEVGAEGPADVDSVAERAAAEIQNLRDEIEGLRAEVEMLRGVGCSEAKAGEPESGPCGVCLRCAEEENARLRAALRGLFKPDGVPYAQWTREMHAAHIALESEQ